MIDTGLIDDFLDDLDVGEETEELPGSGVTNTKDLFNDAENTIM